MSTATPTATRIPLQELEQTFDYMAYTAPIAMDHLTTIELALETASIESSVSIAESFEAAATNLKNLLQFQEDIEAHRLRFMSMPAPQRARHFKGLMQESFSTADRGVGVLIGGYVKYAEDSGFPTREDFESFAETRGGAQSLLVRALRKIGEAIEESTSISDDLHVELDRAGVPRLSGEQGYLVTVNTVVDRFYDHRKDYNNGLEQIGERVRLANTEGEHRRALEQALAHLDGAHRWFREDRDDFASIEPPARFQEFHLLMNAALHDYVGATAAFVTYYSENLNRGTQDLQLADKASELIRTANGSLQRAGYMYAELLAHRDD
ncbi:MAG: hypothetical protein O3A47_07770 [Chloroflexi bacterium]|nr:hypothetical protein [Chloroflexota bacterium]